MDHFTRQYRVHESALAHIAPRINKLAKIADKLGLPPISMTVTGEEFQPGSSGGAVDKWISLELTGALPVINGWRFLGKLSHTEAGNILKGYSAGEIDPRFHACAPNCDHCNTNRQRNETLVVSNVETGEQKQVGSSCIEDFTGHSDPHALLAFYDEYGALGASGEPIYEDIDELAGEPGLHRSTWLMIEDTVATACAVVRKDGRYISASGAGPGEVSTADTVLALMLKAGGSAPQMVEGCDHEKGQQVVEWMRTVESNGQPYFHNLNVLGKSVAFDYTKHMNMVVSACVAYDKSMREKQQHDARLDPATNKHIMEKGEKFDGRLATLEACIPYSSAWGGGSRYVFADAETGATLIWATSAGLTMKRGEQYVISGTVKGHTIYQERAQTEITRVTAPDLKAMETLKNSFRNFDPEKSPKAIKTTIRKMHNPNVVDSANITPLIEVGFYAEEATKDRWLPAINALLASGADPMLQTGYDARLKTPLDIAFFYGGGSPSLADAYLTHLAAKGVDLNALETCLTKEDAASLVLHAYGSDSEELHAMADVLSKHGLPMHEKVHKRFGLGTAEQENGFELNTSRSLRLG